MTTAKTRYGSCSAKNSLCFSCFLMNSPEDAIELVVVHELCHIRVKNHGPAFIPLLEHYLPDYRGAETAPALTAGGAAAQRGERMKNRPRTGIPVRGPVCFHSVSGKVPAQIRSCSLSTIWILARAFYCGV